MLASGHRWKSARTGFIVNNAGCTVAKWRSFGVEFEILTIIARAPLVQAHRDKEEQDG
ncbi:MAG: hypothetical protein J0H42_02390 [Rhizobiales bacterium]|nr:hypothetical protein [Hyphomicrobiales bacterium]